MVGLGVYELYLNGQKQGDEVLLPGLCDFDTWIQYQTYELALVPGENQIEIALGDGWYKGWYGLRQKSENYGDRLAAIAELHITYEDGGKEVICTDTSWGHGRAGLCTAVFIRAKSTTQHWIQVRYSEQK